MGRFLHRRGWLTPYALLTPGMAWLLVFFVVPMYYLGKMSLEQGLFPLFSFSWAWGTFSDAVSACQPQFVRSLQYGGHGTGIALAISYPLAYWIAFRGGRWKNLFLLLVIAPFFVTYLIRTLAWETILSDNGIVVSFLRNIHVLGADGRLLATSAAVIAGITYNFLPFMVLPLYVSLEQVDPRLIEAASDLYANRVLSFLRVTLPLSLPGVFAGVLLTFIPAMGDFINAQLLGTPRQYMIEIAVLSSIVATVLGTLIALALVRYRFRGASTTNLLIFIPMTTPEIVMGASLLTLFLNWKVPQGFGTIFIAHILFNISYVVVTVRARLVGFDRHLEEAAMDLGANEVVTFFRVTLPLIAPGILAAGAPALPRSPGGLR